MNLSELIAQRLMSKTYLVALAGVLVTTVDANFALTKALLPANLQPYLVLVWLILMVIMIVRELTIKPLSEK